MKDDPFRAGLSAAFVVQAFALPVAWFAFVVLHAALFSVA